MNHVRLGVAVLLGFILSACAGTGKYRPSPANQRSSCILVYSGAEYRYQVRHENQPSWFDRNIRRKSPTTWEEEELNSDDIRRGSAVAVSAHGKRFIVTAAHVVARSWQEGEAVASSKSGTLLGGSFRIRVSALSYLPLRLYVDRAADLAILEMPSDFWDKLDVVVFSVAHESPSPGEVVNIWGFPGTPVPQLSDGVKVAMATEEMVVLNKPLDGGFSGSPVIADHDNRLVGMVLRSTDRQSRAMPSGRIMQALAEFERKAITYSEPMEIIR